MFLAYGKPSARSSKFNIVLDATKLPSICLEAVFRFCGHCENLFFSTEHAIITGTLKCPYGMVRYRAVNYKKGSLTRLGDKPNFLAATILTIQTSGAPVG